MNGISNYINFDFESKLEMLKTSEMIAIFQFVFSVTCFALSAIIAKSLKFNITNYNDFSFIFLRFLLMGLINYFICLRQGIERIKINQEDLFWLTIRILSIFLGFMFLNLSLSILRLGTAVCILMTYPVWASFLAIIILKEKFVKRYIVGGIICFTGTVLMSMNERNNKDVVKIIPYTIIMLGVFFSFCNSICAALMQIGIRILANKYDGFYLNYLLGVYCTILAFIMGILSTNFFTDCLNPIILFHSVINAVVSCLAFHYRNISYKSIEVNKVTLLTYLQLVISIIAGYYFFDEMIFYLDILGALMIIGYNLFNVWKISQEKK